MAYTEFADYLFDEHNGKDKFAEDIFTLWLLHFLIVYSEVASIYKLLFVDFQKEKKEFTKSDIQAFIKRKCSIPEQKNVYNENTVKKDIGVLFKQYVSPDDIKAIEDFSSLLIPLNLIVKKNSETFCFRSKSADNIEPKLILFALSIIRREDKTISFDKLQEFEFLNIVGDYTSLDKLLADKLNCEKTNSIDALNKFYSVIKKKNKFLVIVVDEFGKVLEHAANNNPEKELFFLQKLAEFVNVPTRNILLITTLHQNFGLD